MIDYQVQLKAIKPAHGTFSSLGNAIEGFMSGYSNIMADLKARRVNEFNACRLSLRAELKYAHMGTMVRGITSQKSRIAEQVRKVFSIEGLHIPQIIIP